MLPYLYLLILRTLQIGNVLHVVAVLLQVVTMTTQLVQTSSAIITIGLVLNAGTPA